MELVKHHMTVKPGETVTIMPLGDIQWAGADHEVAVSALRGAIQYGQKHKAFYLGMGDYTDFMSPSNRQRLDAAALYDTARGFLDRSSSDLVKDLYERLLKPTVGRWLGLLQGHHFYKYEAGHTSDQELCQLLKAKFLGTCAYIGLVFNDARGKEIGMVNIWLHHGTGGGQSATAPVQKLESLVYGEWEADIYLMGHCTKMAAAPKNRVYPIWRGVPHLSHRKKVLVGSGGFSKGYIEGARQGQVPCGGYVERGMMKPVVLGCPVIRITPRITEVREHGTRLNRVWDPLITVET